jgi:RHS repeat-associated protein
MSSASTTTKNYVYTYDHQGNRVRKYDSVGGVSTVTVNPYYDVTATQYLKHMLVPGIGSIATATTNLSTNRTTLNYHLLDYQQSHLGTMNNSGTITQSIDYYPFGQERSNVKSGYNDSYTFTGEFSDTETGLLYYGARYYSPALARFVSQDPWQGNFSNPQTLNKYSYGLNNPLRYTDPTGAITWDTLAYGTWQFAHSFVTLAEAGVEAFAAGMAAGTGQFASGGLLAETSVATLDDAFVEVTNGFNNMVNGFEDQNTEIIKTQGPYRDFEDALGMSGTLSAAQTVNGVRELVTNPIKAPGAFTQAISLGASTTSDIMDISTGNGLVETMVNDAFGVNTSEVKINTPTQDFYANTTISPPDNSSWYTRMQNVLNE